LPHRYESNGRTSSNQKNINAGQNEKAVEFKRYMDAIELQTNRIISKDANNEQIDSDNLSEWDILFSSINSLNTAAYNSLLKSTLNNQENNISEDIKVENTIKPKLYPQNNTEDSKVPVLSDIKALAREITSQFEGGQLAGDFDGQGISLGYLQWNIGQGTLQPLLKEMAQGSNTTADFQKIFSGTIVYENSQGKKTETTMAAALKDVLARSRQEQLAFAKSINNKNNQIAEPWKSAFLKLTQNKSFIQIEDRYAKPYMDQAEKITKNSVFGVNSDKGYALAFDIAVQNGSVKPSAKALIEGALKGESNKLTNPLSKELTANQRAVVTDLNNRLKNVEDINTKKLYYTAAAVAISSNDKYVKDVWSRKSTIVAGQGKVHGRYFDFKQLKA